MTVGALLDAGLKMKTLEDELKKLGLSGYRLELTRVAKKGISASKFNVKIEEEGVARSFRDILAILEKSKLDEEIKEETKKIFFRIAQAEAKIHQKEIDKIHFHEIGGLDSIIDITSAVIGIKALGIEKIYSSYLPVGKGFVECAHGRIPVPAPATLELLKNIPTYDGGIESEMVTPTGAGIIGTMAESFGARPLMKVEKVGYGAGEKEFSIPNLLRVHIGEEMAKDENSTSGYTRDKVVLVETNIDDMSPEFYDYIMDRLLLQGARDVFLTPIQMKKNRPAHMLTISVYKQNLQEILRVLFCESTTLGVRVKEMDRFCLDRRVFIAETKYGQVKVKLGMFEGKVKNISPEYEDCKRIAQQLRIPLKIVYEEAKKEVYNQFGNQGDKISK
jgi:hypothetical protein